MKKPLFYLLLTFGITCCVLPAAAQKEKQSKEDAAAKPDKATKKNRNTEKDSAAANRSALTPAREAAGMTFAQLHHPELAKLLARLKKKQAKQYEQAMRQLFQTSERLARTRERAPERYELELEAWKLDSRIRLIAARMTMNSDAEMDDELKALVKARAEIRLRQLKAERNRLAERLGRVDSLIEKISSDPEATAAKELQRIKRSVAAKNPRKQKPTERTVTAPNTKRGKPTTDKQKSKKPL